ncbi:MAG: CHAT domain-containing protein [Proteobacteria bacterium]|nr:CHAT domain-containing protein [Pseudomonadota bacterium]
MSLRGFAVALAYVCHLTFNAAASAAPAKVGEVQTLLDREKPDSARQARLAQAAAAPIPESAPPVERARRHFQRSQARAELGRITDAIADTTTAIELARQESAEPLLRQAYVQLGQLQGWLGERRQSNAAFQKASEVGGKRGSVQALVQRINVNRWMVINDIQSGDIGAAESIVRQNHELLAKAEQQPEWPASPLRSVAEAQVAFGDAALAEAQGNYADAAKGYLATEERFRAALTQYTQTPGMPARPVLEQAADFMVARAGRALVLDGRVADGEVEGRRAVTNWLRIGGKYNLNSARIALYFAMTLVDEARLAEAEGIIRSVLEIYRGVGAAPDAEWTVITLNQLAGVLALQNKWQEASAIYGELDETLKAWPQDRKDDELRLTRVATLYQTGRVADGIAVADRMIARERARGFAADHPDLALARGMRAVGLLKSDRAAEAEPELREVAEPLIASLRDVQTDADDATLAATREHRVQTVIEAYIGLLVRQGGGDAASDSLRLAEAIRGRAVQKALTASAVRAAARDPALANLARREQDAERRVGVALASLNGLLSQPSQERDPQAVEARRAAVTQLRGERDALRREVREKYPDYGALAAPRPPGLRELRPLLAPDEAYVSIHLGQDKSYVWVLRKDGPVTMAAVDANAAEIEKAVAHLRQALQPDAATIEEIPAFDLAAAHALYKTLLQPVEAAWRDAKSLIVSTNGSLGLLPLGLLPVAPAELDAESPPRFAGYRKVQWLARSHAVSLVPSSAALQALRRLPPASRAREWLIGFGDPFFNAEQAAAGDAAGSEANATRGVPLARRSAPPADDAVTLASLPRLADTAAELRAIAAALRVDAHRALHLGKAANEDAVKAADLARYRVVVFATHGLMPGELDGLSQPALALTAPEVARVPGDGLLTMDEILALKLDADWVVLSACNTAAGTSTNAEPASGLGRAFFYAGTRAVLATNWSVHSRSARDLVTDLFRRQTADPGLSRAEALRQAMVALIDGKGFADAHGQTVFTYAHPLFWAPYSLVGDGR